MKLPKVNDSNCKPPFPYVSDGTYDTWIKAATEYQKMNPNYLCSENTPWAEDPNETSQT